MTKLISAITMVLFSSIAFGQLKGSGKTITKTYDYINFNKLDFEDLDGKIEVEIGKPFSITVTIDDNLAPLLTFSQNQSRQLLNVYLKGNTNNKLYVENTNIKIKITAPTISYIVHNGNSALVVNGISGNKFELQNKGNANARIGGTIENLEIKNSGNGNVFADQLTAENAIVKCTGNGNVNTNVSKSLKAFATGNCTVKNNGKAPFNGVSSKSGNARLLHQ